MSMAHQQPDKVRNELFVGRYQSLPRSCSPSGRTSFRFHLPIRCEGHGAPYSQKEYELHLLCERQCPQSKTQTVPFGVFSGNSSFPRNPQHLTLLYFLRCSKKINLPSGHHVAVFTVPDSGCSTTQFHGINSSLRSGTTDAPPCTPDNSVFSCVWRSLVFCNLSSTSDPPSNV